MISKSVLFVFVIQFIFQCIHGQVSFRTDYQNIEDSNSHCKIYTLPRTLDEAKAACEREGAVLFYPEDEEEALAIIEYWNKTQPFIHWVIVDLNKSNFTTENGSLISGVYANWASGEPNNAEGNEDCIILSNVGNLKDKNCNEKYAFICKKTEDTIQWSTQCNIPYPGYKLDNEMGKCYKIHLTPKNWTDAFGICYGEQSYLAVTDNEKEATYLVNLMSNLNKEEPSETGATEAVHLGFFNRDGWTTINGVPLHMSGYNKWAQLEPNGGISEDCGAMTSDGLLHDVACSQKLFFVCEHDL